VTEERPIRDTSSRRRVVKFTFFKVDPLWRRLSREERERGKDEMCAVVEEFGDRLMIRSYSLMGMRGDADFLLWQIGDRLEDIQRLHTAIFRTHMGPYLSIPYSYLAMTRRSIYVTRDDAAADRSTIHPSSSRYLFVYPFVKTRAWYKLSRASRQGMMDEHIAVGRKYPSVKLNTTYSYGLDDQEFVVAFETDEPADFLDLVMELRETEASQYTLRDTPIFTCIAMPLREALDALGAPGDVEIAPAPSTRGWRRAIPFHELPPGSRRVVYVAGEEVALLNVEGRIVAFGARCPHANGPLADGQLEGESIVCPWHGSRFHLGTGQPVGGPAARPLTLFPTKVEDGHIWVMA
jgi:chlorite dismutase/nitrite reductase/ring-hydroxylating ferredoxin subunit